MSLSNFIRRTAKSQYFRRLVVRAVEDGIVLFLLGVGVWAVCWAMSGLLIALGVA